MAAPVWDSKGADFSNTSAAPGFAVPPGTAAGKLVIISMFVNVATTLVTGVPAGFSEVPGTPVIGGSNSLFKYWKRLTGADAGTYDFTLDSAQFIEGASELYSNCVASGLPFDPNPGTAFDNSIGSTTPAVNTVTIGPDRLVLHSVTDWAGGTWTPNTGYTRRIQPPVGLVSTSDKLQSTEGTTGLVSAQSTNSDKRIAHIIALIGTTVAGGTMQTISDEARANLLTNRGLSEPQPLSNVDLMKIVLDDGAQVLIPKTNATVAEHYNRYLMTLRDT